MNLWINFQNVYFVKFKFKFILSNWITLICLTFIHMVQNEEYLVNKIDTFIC